MKLPSIPNPLDLFAPAAAGPSLAASGAANGAMMFASSGSSGGSGDDDDYPYDDDFGFEEEPTEPERPRSNRTRRRANATEGRSRTASYQPEERYWTDYLRIALPVIGIVLMLGLLWIWAAQLLGGDNDNGDPTDDETVGLVATETPDAEQQLITTGSTPTATTGANEIPVSGLPASSPTTEAETDLTTANTPETGGDNASADDSAEESTGGTFEFGQYVRVTEENVNMRDDANGDIISTASPDQLYTIGDGPVEAGDYVWWEVVNDETGESGWVAEDFLEAAE